MSSNVLPFTPGERAPAPILVEQVLDAYLADQKSELQPAQYKDRVRLCTRLRATFGKRPVESLRPSELKAWILNWPTYRAANTRKGVCEQVNRILNWAVHDNLIDRNPWRSVSMPEGEPRPQTSEEQLQAMLRVADVSFRQVLVFLRSAGCRPQIARNLDWEFVNWRERWALIPPGKHKAGKRTRKPLRVLLYGAHLKLLHVLARRRQAAGKPLEGPVFLSGRGTRWSLAAFGGRLATLRKHAGLPMSATFHGLRHRAGTDLLVKGVPLIVVSELLGHASTRTTEKYYSHVDEEIESLREWAEKGKGRGSARRDRQLKDDPPKQPPAN
jgi:integrase